MTDSTTIPTEHYIAVYAAMLAIANIAAVKVVSVSGVEFTAGVFPIAAAYLVSDIAVENHGRQFGHRLVRAGIVALCCVIAMTQLIVLLPGDGPATAVLSNSAPLLVASVITIGISQTTDIVLFEAIKNRLPYRPTRNIGSTALSQTLDTTLFTVLGFIVLPVFIGGTQLPLSVVGSIILVETAVKWTLAVVDTPAFLAATTEGDDYVV